MSKRLVRIQRAIFAILANGEVNTGIGIVGAIFNVTELTDAQQVSVQRALASLKRKALVTPINRRHPDGRLMWRSVRYDAKDAA